MSEFAAQALTHRRGGDIDSPRDRSRLWYASVVPEQGRCTTRCAVMSEFPAAAVADVIVIGAGQAGLSAAGELARRGMTPGRDLLVADAAGLGPGDRAGEPLVLPQSWQPVDEPTWVEADTIFWNTGFRAALGHLAPLRLRGGEPGVVAAAGPQAGASSGIRMEGRVSVAADRRVLLVGYGDSASTVGATHAGALAARIALERLG